MKFLIVAGLPTFFSIALSSCANAGVLSDEHCKETVNREVEFMQPYIAQGGFPGITSSDQLRASRMEKCKQPGTWYDEEYRACILALPAPGYGAPECAVEALERRKDK